MLNVFAKLVYELHTYHKKHKRTHSSQDAKSEELKKTPKKMSSKKSSMSKTPQVDKIDMNGIYKNVNQDGITTNNWKRSGGQQQNLVDTSLQLPSQNLIGHPINREWSSDPRKFLRADGEPNSQIHYMLSKYIFQVKSGNKWGLKSAVNQRFKNAQIAQYGQNTFGAARGNSMPPVTNVSTGQPQISNVGKTSINPNLSVYNMSTPIREQNAVTQPSQIGVPAMNATKFGYNMGQNAYPNVVGVNANTRGHMSNGTHLPGIRNILSIQEVM